MPKQIFRLRAVLALATVALISARAYALDTDQLDPSALLSMKPHTAHQPLGAGGGGVLGNRFYGASLGLDTLTNFSGYFYDPGVVPSPGGDFLQFTWQYTMVGRSPVGTHDREEGDDSVRTVVRSPIVPVIIDLRNYDGSPRYYPGPNGPVRMILDPTQYIQPVLKSPIFEPTHYDSSFAPTQFTDAIMRAEFFSDAGPGWHTLLRPVIAPTRTMVLVRGTYRFAVDSTGHVIYVLVDDNTFAAELFPPTPDDTSSVMGAAENAGDIRTKDLSTFLFANTFLYQNGNPADCCILGYHTYDVEPGGSDNGFRERRYVMDYSSWISPGLFGPAFTDVTALSHELSEAFNDPFVNNATPIWVAPNGNCQNNLETGDVIEGLPNATIPITLNGFTYHPQNEALLEWFAGQQPSSAVDHAYSYPDATVLPTPAVSVHSDCATPVVVPH
ncbi:MAG: hypothetical protein JOZ03_13875 [Gammaproteobacteria bacterium]|nr:hypothetical protein [Gammaproteobacteria bacterium]